MPTRFPPHKGEAIHTRVLTEVKSLHNERKGFGHGRVALVSLTAGDRSKWPHDSDLGTPQVSDPDGEMSRSNTKKKSSLLAKKPFGVSVRAMDGVGLYLANNSFSIARQGSISEGSAWYPHWPSAGSKEDAVELGTPGLDCLQRKRAPECPPKWNL